MNKNMKITFNFLLDFIFNVKQGLCKVVYCFSGHPVSESYQSIHSVFTDHRSDNVFKKTN